MDKITIMSLNSRGLRNSLKRRKVWHYVKHNKIDICLLQECHATKKDEHLWATEFGSKCIFANGESNARGIAILCNKFGDRVTNVTRDVNGRYL